MANHLMTDAEKTKLTDAKVTQYSQLSSDYSTTSSTYADTGLAFTLAGFKTYYVKVVLQIYSANDDGFKLRLLSTALTESNYSQGLIGINYDIKTPSSEIVYLTAGISPTPHVCSIANDSFTVVFDGIVKNGVSGSNTVKIQLASTTDTKQTTIYYKASILMATLLD